MGRLAHAAARQSFATIPEFKAINNKGIESYRIAMALEDLGVALDAQASYLDDWREHVIQLLLKPLVDEEDSETTGEEYEQSTKLQDEILVYLQVLRTAIADRQAVLTGQKNFLVEHETNVAARLAKAGNGPYPEKLLELLKIRDTIKPPFQECDPLSSLRGLLSELRSLSAKLRNDAAMGSSRAAAEQAILSNLLKSTLNQQSEQMKAATAMEKELQQFMDTVNARIEFYRQLQEVSDMVADYKGPQEESALAAALENLERQEESLQTKLAATEAKHRYCKLTFNTYLRIPWLTQLSSASSQGGRSQLRGTAYLYHLPEPIHDWRLDHLRASVLQGMHDVVVQGASELPSLQAPFDSFKPP